MTHKPTINIIDQDILLAASGFITARPSEQMAIVLTGDWDEARVREFFRAHWAIELSGTFMNDMIASHTGIETLSMHMAYLPDITRNPVIVELTSIDELRNAGAQIENLQNNQADKGRVR